MRRFAIIMTVLAVTACGGVSVNPPDGAAVCQRLPLATDPALQAELDAIVDSATAEGFAGQVALTRNGALIYQRAAGRADLEGEIPVRDDTLFHVASITKYVTAALTLAAADEGRLDLDGSIAPHAEGAQLGTRGVTFADLLAHRTGLGTTFVAEATNDPQAALEAIDATPIDDAQAGAFRYSSDGYDLLGILLERVYGQTFETAVREHLLARTCVHAEFWGEASLGDPRQVGQPLTQVSENLRRRNYGMLGAAGLLISATDLVTWQNELKSGRVLSEESLRQLFAPRGAMRLGQATFGAFLIDHPEVGRVFSARGYEDWGDNAILNDYLDCGFVLAVVTSRGPAESTGLPPFRDSISQSIEAALSPRCSRPTE